MSADDALAALPGARDRARAAERELREAVKAARTAGATWQRVADALGVAKQTAWERFYRVEWED